VVVDISRERIGLVDSRLRGRSHYARIRASLLRTQRAFIMNGPLYQRSHILITGYCDVTLAHV